MTIKCENLSKDFFNLSNRVVVTAVKDANFNAEPGKITGLIGENGSGKSTILKMLSTIIRPTGGEIRVEPTNGKWSGRRLKINVKFRLDLPTLGAGNITIWSWIKPNNGRHIRQIVSYLPEDPRFHFGVSGRNFLLYLTKLRGIPNPLNQVNAWIDRFGLTDWTDAPTNIYSKGMKQRLALAATFLADTPIILLDEPTENLDRHHIEVFREIIAEEKEKGRTIIIASHQDNLISWMDQKYELVGGTIK